nr:nucleotidyltransferase domain-containing protein [uncultured Bacillus sp.]
MEQWLKEMEAKYHIRILFAAETGSRAWGGATEHSDYDVRFIFHYRDVKTYLSLEKAAETIESLPPIDAQGWDIFKAFALLMKSNPSLLEWSLSPIVYRNWDGFAERLFGCAAESFSSYALYQHYIHLMVRNLKEIGGQNFSHVSQKKLIQAVRSYLLAKDIILTGKVPHEALYSSFTGIIPDEDGLVTFYHQLMQAKQHGILVPLDEVYKYREVMEKQRTSFEPQLHSLHYGNNICDKLNQWIWEILEVD